MNKGYLFVPADEFTRLGVVDGEGHYPRVRCEGFDFPNDRLNNLIIQVKYREHGGVRVYAPRCEELSSGMVFYLEQGEVMSEETGEKYDTIQLYSPESGLRTKELPLGEVLVRNSKASTLAIFFENHPVIQEEYLKKLKTMMVIAADTKYAHDHSIKGPDRYSVRQLRANYKEVEIEE